MTLTLPTLVTIPYFGLNSKTNVLLRECAVGGERGGGGVSV